MKSIENEYLKVTVSELGAEIKAIYDKKNKRDLFYDGLGGWNCTDHVLFPFIGPDSDYLIDGKHYSCPTQHGFLRTSTVKVTKLLKDEIIMTLEENEETKKVYPFSFRLTMDYKLNKNNLTRTYTVLNKGKELLPFVIGDHPAYKVLFGRAILHFNSDRIMYLPRPNFVLQKPEILNESQDYLLKKEDFKKYETIVIKNPHHDIVLDNGLGNKITYHFTSPYIAIWSPILATDQFVCIEPWWGIPQYQDMPLEFTKRKEITLLDKEKIFASTIEFNQLN